MERDGGITTRSSGRNAGRRFRRCTQRWLPAYAPLNLSVIPRMPISCEVAMPRCPNTVLPATLALLLFLNGCRLLGDDSEVVDQLTQRLIQVSARPPSYADVSFDGAASPAVDQLEVYVLDAAQAASVREVLREV